MNSLSTLSAFGKYLDQPRLVKRFTDAVPVILVLGGAGYTLYSTNKAPQGEKRKEFIKNGSVLTGTIASAFVAPKIASLIVKGHHHHSHFMKAEKIDKFIENNHVSGTVKEILNLAKEKILKPSKIKILFEELGNRPEAKKFLSGDHGLIPDPENIDSKHIFGEIGRLSILGLIPVLGGISGGIIGDKITEKDWKQRIPNKIKEGTYQYLANIFLCNIGAGGALLALEKAKIQSKAARAFGMIGGILLTGLIGGSAIANFIGKKVVDPMFKHNHHINQESHKREKLYDERKPELLDVSLHVDDIATVAVLSGLKWIEPALPILYSISGYRAGIGYRNNEKGQNNL